MLRDRLRLAPVQEIYLLGSQDKFLAPVLQAFEAHPGDNTMLARRCRQDLHMSFGEWRPRLRFLHAIAQLRQAKSVQAIAYNLGYSSASALIVMFQQQAGTRRIAITRAWVNARVCATIALSTMQPAGKPW